ncbi:hypothetical protein [Methanimicrococcus hacksteinii]|nr:hypothetical protein [Methanimicrococcus sp. At1]
MRFSKIRKMRRLARGAVPLPTVGGNGNGEVAAANENRKAAAPRS